MRGGTESARNDVEMLWEEPSPEELDYNEDVDSEDGDWHVPQLETNSLESEAVPSFSWNEQAREIEGQDAPAQRSVQDPENKEKELSTP